MSVEDIDRFSGSLEAPNPDPIADTDQCDGQEKVGPDTRKPLQGQQGGHAIHVSPEQRGTRDDGDKNSSVSE